MSASLPTVKIRRGDRATVINESDFDPKVHKLFDAPAKAAKPAPSGDDETTTLRAEYEAKAGKRPFMGWDADKLRDKIAAL